MTHNNRNSANIQYFTDFQFGQNDYGNQYNKRNNIHNHYNNNNNARMLWKKKYYVCGKENYCSNKYLNHK